MNIAEEVDPEDTRAYPNRPAWQRFVTIFAGPATNYLSAIVLAFCALHLPRRRRARRRYVAVDDVLRGLRRGRQARGRRPDPRGRSRAAVSRATATRVADRARDGEEGRADAAHRAARRQLVRRVDHAQAVEGRRRQARLPARHQAHRRGRHRPRRHLRRGGTGADVPGRQTEAILGGLRDIITGAEKADPGGPKRIVDEFSKAFKLGFIYGIELADAAQRLPGPVQPVPAPRARRRPAGVPGYEMVTRRRANPKIEAMVHMGGIMVLGVVMIAGDVARLPRLLVRFTAAKVSACWPARSSIGSRPSRASTCSRTPAARWSTSARPRTSARACASTSARAATSGSSSRRASSGARCTDVETIVVSSSKEALLLENHLIKKHQPKFNVKLRDDKQYLVLRLVDPSIPGDGTPKRDVFPRVEVVRNIRDDGAQLLRPVSLRDERARDAAHAQPSLPAAHLHRSRARDPRPTVPAVPDQALLGPVRDRCRAGDLRRAGRGREDVPRRQERRAASTRLRARMEVARRARGLRGRRGAARLDRAPSSARSRSQHIVQDEFVDQDVWGLYREADAVEVVVLFVRGGKLVGRRAFQQKDQELPDAAVIAEHVQQYYATGTFIPDEVVVGVELEEAEVARGVARRGARQEGEDRRAAPRDPGAPGRARGSQRGGLRAARARSKDADAEALLDKVAERLDAARGRRSGSSASTSRTSRAPTRSRRW